jgi:ABC-type amino acid transport substrate-binding protein
MALVALASESLAACDLTLRVRNAPPRYFQDHNAKWTGSIVQQAEALAKEADCNLTYRNVSWTRGMILLESGGIDMMGLMSITEERKKFLNFVGPYSHELVRLLVKKETNFDIKSHEDLLKLPGKIAVHRSGWFGKKFAALSDHPEYANTIELIGSADLTQEVTRIKMGRLTGYLASISGRLPKSDLFHGLKLHHYVINRDPIYFGLSKKSVEPDLATRRSMAKSAT